MSYTNLLIVKKLSLLTAQKMLDYVQIMHNHAQPRQYLVYFDASYRDKDSCEIFTNQVTIQYGGNLYAQLLEQESGGPLQRGFSLSQSIILLVTSFLLLDIYILCQVTRDRY